MDGNVNTHSNVNNKIDNVTQFLLNKTENGFLHSQQFLINKAKQISFPVGFIFYLSEENRSDFEHYLMPRQKQQNTENITLAIPILKTSITILIDNQSILKYTTLKLNVDELANVLTSD